MTAAYPTPVSDDPIEGRPLPPVAMFTPRAEPERIDREAPYYAASRGLALRETFEDAQITDRLLGFIQADDARARADQRRIVFGEESEPLLSVEEANARYGVPGRLTFDAPVDRNIAAWRQSQAQRAAFRDEVTANADLSWWQTLGAGFAGSLLDPAALPLWMVPELAAGRALKGAAGFRALGPVAQGVARGAAEGVAGGVLVEGANLWLHHEAADDYDFGQASANVLLGGLLGAGLGGVGGWWEGRGRAPRAPAAIERMDGETQLGAFVDTLDAMIEDRPVDLGPVLRAEAEARTAGRLDPEAARRLGESEALAADMPARPLSAAGERRLDDALAVTPRGQEIPVRFALVEAEDLVTSHDDDLFPNGAYPRELQPRMRDRAGAIARNRQLEAELNPRRLLFDVGAETGAPIASRDGIVESGNGRTIALRRSYATGSGAAKRYRAELEAQGFDVSGLKAPVLVRQRTNVLTGEERVRLTREMNAEATEAYSPSERASADAAGLDDGLLALLDGADLNAASNRRFVKGFLDRVASDDLNRMTTADGRLSDAGLARIQAAMVARAYGDRGLVEALFEATDSQIKAIGKALVDAAPEWAAMRAAVARGEAPAALDLTDSLTAAVAFVREVRARRGSVEEAMDLIIGQYDAFSGSAMTPETEAFVRSFFRTSDEGATLWKSPRSSKSLGEALRKLAGEVQKAEPGPNLFGDVADAATGRQLLDAFAEWLRRDGDDGFFDFGPEPSKPAGGDAGPSIVAGRREPGGPEAGGEAEKPRLGIPETSDDAGLEGALTALAKHADLDDVTALRLASQEGRLDPDLADLAFLLDQALGSEGEARARWLAKAARAGAELDGTAKPRIPKGETPPSPKGEPFADPEVAALAADTEAMMRREGIDPATVEADDPQTLADAIAAGAACLKSAT